jgi:HAE1 family hydrophobic/amphiphilic exporter-1
MFLSEFSIKRPIATVVLIIALMAVGLLALSKLRVNQIPDVEQPVLTVGMTYPGASPETVEREVVNRIEKALQGISGIYQVRSTSSESLWPDRAVLQLRQEHDRSRRRGAQCHRLGALQAAGGDA